MTPGRPSSCSAIVGAAVLPLLVVGRLQGDREVGRAAVVGDEVGGAGVVVAADRLDVAAARRSSRSSAATRARRRRARRPARARGRRSRRGPRRPASSSCLLGLDASRSPGRRRRRGRAGRRPSRRARRRGGRSAIAIRPIRRARRSARRARASNIRLLLLSAAGSSSSASIRSHQSANHSLNSIPPCSTISGERVVLLDRLRFHRPQLLGDARGARSRIARRISTASSGSSSAGEEQLQQAFVAHLGGLRGLAQPVLQLVAAGRR